MSWLHIDFWFKIKDIEQDRYITEEQQKDFEDILRSLIVKLKPKRKFYLWEPVPHCALIIEGVKISKARHLVKNIHRNYIDMVKVNIKDAKGDSGNGEGALNVWDAFCDFYLFHRDNKISHVIHCCLEPIFHERRLENEFYQKMAVMYQEAKVIDGKKTYFYKEITPEVAKELENYRNALDLG